MKKNVLIRIASLGVAVLMLAGLFCACSSSGSKNLTEDSAGAYADAIPGGNGVISSENSTVIANRKLVQNVNLTLQTNEYDAFTAALSNEIDTVGGYIESQRESTRATRNYRSASYTLRIPADKLNSFLETVSSIATVTNKSSSTEDITDNYIDTESRLAALEKEYESLLKLLEKAESLTDIMQIQERIYAVQAELDSYKARLEAYDNQVTYATVIMSVNEVERTDEAGKGFWTTVGENLADNFGLIGDGFRAIAIFLLSAIPFFLILGVVAVVVIVIIKLAKRARRKRRDKNTNESEE